MSANRAEPFELQNLRGVSSTAVANAIETLGVRLRNSGFTDSSVHCIFPDLPPTVGYAATVRIRTAQPPMEGDSYYYRLDWLDHVLSIPSPRILVVQDMDQRPGLGAFIGDVHTNVLLALQCIAVVTNGAVRNVEEARALRFQMYAGNLSVSHAFAHVLDFGGIVDIGPMQVRPGDLLHGDGHGIQTIPMEIAGKVAEVAQKMIEEEREIIKVCRSAEFSTAKLRAEVAALGAKRKMEKT
jgi:regulator of RNase E activity RraA